LRLKTRRTLTFTPEHAARALHVLIADGKIAAHDVATALKRREKTIRELKARLAALEGSVGAKVRGAARKAKKKGRRKLRLSATRRAALKAHGKYLGAVRMLSKGSRAKVKEIREKKGVRAAIAAARKMGK
jgi:hypothetical protein